MPNAAYPTDDLEPFEAPLSLVQSVKESLPDFERACNAIIQTSDWDVIRHRDPKTGDEIVRSSSESRWKL